MATHGEINPSTADLILGTATNALDTARSMQTRRSGSIYLDDGTDSGGGIVLGGQAAEYQGAARVDADGNMSPLVDTSQLEQDIKDAGDKAQSAADSAAEAITQASQSAQAAKDASDKADAAAAEAAAAAGVAGTASDKAQSASDKADAASSKADTASDKADAAASQAAAASDTAKDASDTAGRKSTVLIQASAPDAAYRSSLTLWIDTTDGANTPKRWNGSAWVAVTDKQAVDAAAKAVEAKSAADAAAEAAKTATTDAATALTNANTALARATHVTTGQTKPTKNVVTGDIWFPTDGSGNVTGMKTWGGSAWVDVQLVAGSVLVPGSVGATTIADGAITTPKLTVTEDMVVELLKAHKVEADEIDLNTLKGNTISGITLSGSTVTGGTLQTAASGKRIRIRTNSGAGVIEMLSDDTLMSDIRFIGDTVLIGRSANNQPTSGIVLDLKNMITLYGQQGIAMNSGLGGIVMNSYQGVTLNASKAGSNTYLYAYPEKVQVDTASVELNATNGVSVKDSSGTATLATPALNHDYASCKFTRADGAKSLNNGVTYTKLASKTGTLSCSIGSDARGSYVTGLAAGVYHVQAGMLTSEDSGSNIWRVLSVDVGGSAVKIGLGRGEYNTTGGYNAANASCLVKISKTTDTIRAVSNGNKTATMRDNGTLAITRI